MNAKPGLSRLFFVSFLVINSVLWSQSRYGRFHTEASTGGTGLAKRGELVEKECHPITFPVDQQCQHAQERCPAADTFLAIDYLGSYFCLTPALRPIGFAGLLLWLIFLFSTLGISASDFFTPNLATIAHLLGLDENVAGVTFLAFGNGSPDVFSTFSAMRAGSGGLAIGELIGAASFIVSVVVGSMCIIKPFQVNRAPFLRDVGVFSVAIVLLLVILVDNHIFFAEAAGLVCLYLFYVAVVIVQSWWERQQEARRATEAQIRSEYDESSPLFTPYRDNQNLPPQQLTLAVPTALPGRLRAVSSPNPPRLQTNLPMRPHSRSPSPARLLHSPRLPSFSLVGALEFRQAVNQLNHHAAGPHLNVFDSPVTPFAGGHYHAASIGHSRSPSTETHFHTLPRSASRPPWFDIGIGPLDTAPEVPLNDRTPPRVSISRPSDSDGSRQNVDEESEFTHSSIPSISVTPTPTSPILSPYGSDTNSSIPGTFRHRRYTRILKRILHTLFPSLYHFGDKTALGKLACIFAAPAVMMLTLTLPVVVTPYEYPHSPSNGSVPEGRLVDFEEEGVARTLVAEEEMKGEALEMDYNKWLMAVQCIIGPLFSVAVLFNTSRYLPWILIITAITGVTVAALVVVFAEHGKNSTMLTVRCFMGFFVAIVWIMAVADEVVNILRTFGFIFGLSDAIIGLTIFAVGNSLADLVANMSVATFAPIMGFSACFGGPMLNILLGVGIAGSYNTYNGQAYTLDFSTTLLVSTIGLLALLGATLVFVPLNGYFLTRTWGVFLILAYICIMTTNVVVESFSISFK